MIDFRSVRWVSLVVAAAVMAIAPADARAAPVVAVDRPCYRSDTVGDDAMHVTGSGFTPGVTLLAKVDDESVRVEPADESGRIDSWVSAPPVYDSITTTLRVWEADRPEIGAETAVRVTDWNMFYPTPRPSLGRPSRRSLFTFRGWPAGSTIYAHYLHRGRRRVATRRVAVVGDPCVPIRRRRLHIPRDILRLGPWDVWYTTSPTNPHQAPSMMERVDIVRIATRHRRRLVGSRIGVQPAGRWEAHRD